MATIRDHSDTLVVTAWGVGKSVACAYAGWMLATKWERGLPGLFFAPTAGQLQRTLLQAWEGTVARPGCYRTITSGPNPRIEIPLPGGDVSTIYLLSGEQYTAARIEGLNLAWVCGDELQDVDKAVWDRVVGRVRHKKAKRLRRFGAGLPESGTWLEEALEIEPDPTVRWVKGRTSDNPHVHPDYIANLKRTLPPHLFRSRGLGLFANPEGLVYSTFSREKHVRPSPYVPGVRVLIGQDFNNAPMASVICQDVGSETRVVGEIIEPGTTAEQAERLVAWCRKRGINHRNRAQCLVIPDASGSARQHAAGESDHAILVKAGFVLAGPAANPRVKDRDNAVLARLETADGVHRLFLDPSCRRTIAALGGLKHKGRERSEHSHPADALGYVVHRFHALETPDYAGMASISAAAARAAREARPQKSTW